MWDGWIYSTWSVFCKSKNCSQQQSLLFVTDFKSVIHLHEFTLEWHKFSMEVLIWNVRNKISNQTYDSGLIKYT